MEVHLVFFFLNNFPLKVLNVKFFRYLRNLNSHIILIPNSNDSGFVLSQSDLIPSVYHGPVIFLKARCSSLYIYGSFDDFSHKISRQC